MTKRRDERYHQALRKKASRWKKTYYGDLLSSDQLDRYSLVHIPDKLLEVEPELYDKKWFDYRLLHPAHATMKLSEFYAKAYSLAADEFGHGMLRPFKGDNIFENHNKHRHPTHYWRMRQYADQFGVEYEFFTHHFVREVWMKKYANRRPTMSQMCGQLKEFGPVVVQRWSEHCETSFVKANDSFFAPECYHEHRYQKAYGEYVCDYIIKRGRSKWTIKRFVFDENLMSEKFAIERFGSDLIEDARELAAA